MTYIKASSIEEATQITQEFVQAYQKFVKENNENQRALGRIADDHRRASMNLADSGHYRDSDKQWQYAGEAENKDNSYWFWEQNVSPIAKKYHLSLEKDSPIIDFDITGVGYAEIDLRNPTELYKLEDVTAPIWHGLRHKEVSQKKVLGTLQVNLTQSQTSI